MHNWILQLLVSWVQTPEPSRYGALALCFLVESDGLLANFIED